MEDKLQSYLTSWPLLSFALAAFPLSVSAFGSCTMSFLLKRLLPDTSDAGLNAEARRTESFGKGSPEECNPKAPGEARSLVGACYVLLPAFVVPDHTIDMATTRDIARSKLDEASQKQARKADSIIKNTLVQKRHVCRPVAVIMARETQDSGAAQQQYMASFALAVKAARQALWEAGIAPMSVDAVVSVSCTGIAMPHIGGLLNRELGLRPTTSHLPVSQWGCAAGVACLRWASAYCHQKPDAVVLCVNFEACSSMYHGETDMSSTVCAALFGDAAGASIVLGHDNTEYLPHLQHRVSMGVGRHAEVTIPGTQDYMFYDVTTQGLHFRLSRHVRCSTPKLMPYLKRFLAECGTDPAQKDFNLVIHTGGPRILREILHELYGQATEGCPSSISEEHAQRVEGSFLVLKHFGNVAGVTICGSMRQSSILLAKRGVQGPVPCVTLACGPGMNMQMLYGQLYPVRLQQPYMARIVPMLHTYDTGCFDVVIVGGGPTGMVAAKLLVKYGLKVALVEKYKTAYRHARADHIDASTLRILRRAGVSDHMQELRPCREKQVMTDLSSQDPEATLTWERQKVQFGDGGFAPTNYFDQCKLERSLRDSLTAPDATVGKGEQPQHQHPQHQEKAQQQEEQQQHGYLSVFFGWRVMDITTKAEGDDELQSQPWSEEVQQEKDAAWYDTMGTTQSTVRVCQQAASGDDNGDQASEVAHALQAPMVLGCDGANSMVRELIAKRREPASDSREKKGLRHLGPPAGLIQTDFRLPTDNPCDFGVPDIITQTCVETRTGTRTLAIVPANLQRRIRLVFGALPSDAIFSSGALQSVRSGHDVSAVAGELVSQVFPKLDMRYAIRTVAYTITPSCATHWASEDGSFVLAGDAAHVMMPFMGQGLCSGLRDVNNVSWKLAYVLQGLASRRLITETYQEERGAHAASLIQASTSIPQQLRDLNSGRCDPSTLIYNLDRNLITMTLAQQSSPTVLFPRVLLRDQEGNPLWTDDMAEPGAGCLPPFMLWTKGVIDMERQSKRSCHLLDTAHAVRVQRINVSQLLSDKSTAHAEREFKQLFAGHYAVLVRPDGWIQHLFTTAPAIADVTDCVADALYCTA